MSFLFAADRIRILNVDLFSGSVDPSAGAGVVAPIGSKFLRENGEDWAKTGAGDTAWTKLGAGGNFTFSTTQRVLGRNSAGGGAGEEVTASQILDWVSNTSGVIMRRGSSAWVASTITDDGTTVALAGRLSIGAATKTPAASIIATSAAIANTETQVGVLSIPANTIVAGQTYIVRAFGQGNAVGGQVETGRVRLGPTTLTGPIVASLPRSATAQVNKEWEAVITIRSVGASGTALGNMTFRIPDGTGYDFTIRNLITAPVTIDTTVVNLLEFTYISGIVTQTTTFYLCCISQVF